MGIAERRERERQRRRNEIIDAAEKIFFANGFENASVESVTNEAELSKATLYLYFKSKEELYFAVCMRGQDKLFSTIEESVVGVSDTVELIVAYLGGMVRFQKKYPDYFNSLFYFQTHPVSLVEDNEDVQRNREMDRYHLNKWIELIEKGKKEGLIRKNVNPIQTVLLIWMQLSGFLKMYSAMQPELKKDFNYTEEELLQEYYNLILHGITIND